jgi:hypothetical protein
MSSHWQVGHGGRSSGQLRLLSRREAVFVYERYRWFAASQLVREGSIRCPFPEWHQPEDGVRHRRGEPNTWPSCAFFTIRKVMAIVA